MFTNKLLSNNQAFNGIYRGRLLQKSPIDIRVFVPGIYNSQIKESDLERMIDCFPKIQWCAYNLESIDMENQDNNGNGPAMIMFENGDLQRPVVLSYVVIGGGDSSDGYYDENGNWVGGTYSGTGSTGNSNADYIFNELIKAGASIAGASGVLANIDAESGFSTALNSGDNGKASGIAQWHPDRWANLESYCSSKGLDSKSIEGQTAFLIHELQQYSDLWSTICSAQGEQGAYNAAYKMCYDFERPSNKESRSDERGNLAKTNYFQTFKNGTIENKNYVYSNSNIVNEANNYLGVKYVYGGTSPSGFDCSGLTYYVYSKCGISIPRTAEAQWNDSNGKKIDKSNLQPGDLVFFNGSSGSSTNPGHVGIYIGDDKYIHAPYTGEVVKISNLSSRKDYVGAKRY